MKISFILAGFILLSLISSATLPPTYSWSYSTGGSGDDYGTQIVLDATGNVYTLGTFDGTVDFDPGPAVYNLTAPFNVANQIAMGMFIKKTNSAGKLLWAKSISNSADPVGLSMKLDALNNIYIAGEFNGTVDFNPGAGVFNLSSTGTNYNTDAFILKLDSIGNFIFAQSIGGVQWDEAKSIAIDAANNVYVMGLYSGVVDLNPGAGVFNVGLVSLTKFHTFLIKLNSAGVFQWGKVIGGTSGIDICSGSMMKLDAAGVIYLTGRFEGTVDFNPSGLFFNLASANNQEDIFVEKLDATGNFIWAKQMGGLEDDGGNAIAIDVFGGIYITGYFNDAADFNPNAGVYTLINYANNPITNTFICKLDGNGNFQWAKSLVSDSLCSGYDIAVNTSGNVYSIGTFKGVADFDPGPSLDTIRGKDGNYSMYLSVLDAAGNFLWAEGIHEYYGGDVLASSFVLNSAGYIYITGSFNGNIDFNIFAPGINNITGHGGKDIFVAKLSQCIPPAITTALYVDACQGSTFTPTATGASTYEWSNGTITANSFLVSADGNYTVTATDAQGCSNTETIHLFMHAKPTISILASGNAICSGYPVTLHGVGATIYSNAGTYAWTGGISDSIPFFPTSTSTYTVTGTTMYGCSNTASQIISVSQSPTISITASASVICAGTAITLSSTGASIYSWSGGISNGVAFIPLATTSYTVTGTASNGCTASAIKTISVNPSPSLVINATASVVCSGNPVTLTASGGAASYLWSGGIQNGLPFIPFSPVNTYSVTAVSANGCSNTATKLIQVVPLPVVQSTVSSNSVCAGSSVTFNAFGALTFSWSGGISNGVPFVPSSSATYTVTGTNGSGCTNSSTKIVEVNPIPFVGATTSSGTICEGEQIILSGSGADYYLWTNGITDGEIFTPSSTSTYTVTGITNAGCAATRTMHIVVNPLPAVTANASSNVICLGDSLILSSGDTTNLWNNGVQEGVSFVPNASAVYVVTATNSYGCTNTSSQIIHVNPCLIYLDLKCFIQGYFLADETMTSTLYNEGEELIQSNNVDSISVELHFSVPPYALAATYTGILQSNGSIQCTFPHTMLNYHYYIVVKHRSSIETWSLLPIILHTNLFYNFSSAASQAYGNNMIEVEQGVFAFYSGDITQDENVDLLDATVLENGINDFQFGYYATDINGDGNVDLLDAPIVETNINQFVFSSHP